MAPCDHPLVPRVFSKGKTREERALTLIDGSQGEGEENLFRV